MDADASDPAPASDQLTEAAIALAGRWLTRADELESRRDRRTMEQLGELVHDEDGVEFVMQFVDRVARPDSADVAARQLQRLVDQEALPAFLTPLDRLMLRAGAMVAPRLPRLVMPIAKWRMRSIVGHLVAPAEPEALAHHLSAQRNAGYVLNVNLLGEAVLGEREAEARRRRLRDLIAVPEIDYVSVKITAVASQINHWDYETSLDRISHRLAELVDHAARASPVTFINFDMEEYHDLHLTVEAFTRVLGDPARAHLDAGIVLQAYLPDSFEILQQLTAWADKRNRAGGGTTKIRLVKGANLAMEQVEAAMHGWPQAPFDSKLETDASYRRCLDWVLTPERLTGTRIGVASHNLFDVAWAKELAEQRGVIDRVQFEMLQGMASGQAEAVNEATEAAAADPMLLYTPAVEADDFDVAIAYLFRRLEENAAPQNFMRKLFELEPGTSAFRTEADFFRRGVAMRNQVASAPRRTQDRSEPYERWPLDRPFANEPDTDPTRPANRDWIAQVAVAAATQPTACTTPITTDVDELTEAIERARGAQSRWWGMDPAERRAILRRVGDVLADRRGEAIAAMMYEASKTVGEADVEVSEAIDFARYYADRSLDLYGVAGADFTPFGVIGVIPPWNFPTAIPAGGVLASLAAGNAVIFKPATETPRCAELVAEACWAAGVPDDVLQFVRTHDDEVGRTLVESVDAVILTGSIDTADLFLSWKPRLRLLAETSGKNALIITPSADLDLAAQDLIHSAFGHAGQKCSAASLAILVGDVAESKRFRRQLVDAAESLTLGPATDRGTDIAPLVAGGNARLTKAVETLQPGERWLVCPRMRADGVLSPGIRDGVRPGSWFHRTECFGPILGLMEAADLDAAIAMANAGRFALTGGIHTLDPLEVRKWADEIEVGNGYVNRPITGAIVRRQPFGGWKHSSVGPGAKAGGVNYVAQLGTWHPHTGPLVPRIVDTPGVSTIRGDITEDYAEAWAAHFAVPHDETGLFCEANIFRYRPLPRIGVYIGAEATEREVELVNRAAEVSGVQTVVVADRAVDDIGWIDEMVTAGIERVRLIGAEITDELATAANEAHVRLAAEPVTAVGRIELQHYVREQSMAVTLHRFGNLVAPPRLS